MARTLVTSSNVSPLVLIITWFVCILSALSMIARGITKVIFSRSISPDDYTSISSLFLNIAQSGAVTVQTQNGLGKHMDTLTTTQIAAYSKASYAAKILYIIGMCLSEVSVLLFIKRITPLQRDRRMLQGVGLVTVAWTVIGVVVSAAECGSPKPWDYFGGSCIDSFAWWISVEAMNILINAALVAVPAFILSGVQMPLMRRISVSLMFALRITVCAASICKIVYWTKAHPSADRTFAIWPVTLCTQIIQFLSIASFCFLYLKPLFEALETGFIRSDELRRKGQTTSEGSYVLSTIRSGKDRAAKRLELLTHQNGRNDTTITAMAGNEASWDRSSQNSEAQIIRKTRTWAIESTAADDERIYPG